MKTIYAVFVILLGLAAVAVAQQPIGFIDGHSAAGFQLQVAGRDFPAISWQGNTHFSLPCARLLQLLPYDFKLVRGTPAVVIVWLGTTDAENHHAVGDFMTCAKQYVTLILQQWPQAKIVMPNVTPFNYATYYGSGYGDTRPDVAAYNAALSDPNTGMEATFPGQVWLTNIYSGTIDETQCILATPAPECYANSNFISYVDLNGFGQTAADLYMQPVVYKAAGLSP